jgi:hypothetical protein
VQSQIDQIFSSRVVGFGKRASDATTGYGFSALGVDGLLAVSQDYTTYYIHPSAAGTNLRTGTATSLPSYAPGGYGDTTSYYGQTVTQNITFDQPHTEPPLIFVTRCDGPIAFNGMITDANGKYIGASIVAASSFVGLDQSWKGVGAYQGNTYGFTYFIVSPEAPVYRSASTYGMQVFDGSGNVVFDSRNFVPAFSKTTIPTPYLYFPNYSYTPYNTFSFSKAANVGICINNLPSICGHVGYYSLNISGLLLGPNSLLGRYLSTSDTGGYVYGYGTCAFFCTPEIGASFDYTLQNAPNLDLFSANYSYSL